MYTSIYCSRILVHKTLWPWSLTTNLKNLIMIKVSKHDLWYKFGPCLINQSWDTVYIRSEHVDACNIWTRSDHFFAVGGIIKLTCISHNDCPSESWRDHYTIHPYLTHPLILHLKVVKAKSPSIRLLHISRENLFLYDYFKRSAFSLNLSMNRDKQKHFRLI